MDVSSNRLFRFSKPEWLNNSAVRNAGVYTSGALVRLQPTRRPCPPCPPFHLDQKANNPSSFQFAAGFFFLIDVASFSHSPRNGSDVHIKFVDWIPGICSALGMLVINSIEKSRLQADSFSYSGGGVAWKARFVLFLGFALLAGGLAGSVVRCNPYSLDLLRVIRGFGFAGQSEEANDVCLCFADGHGTQVPR
jgi:hypothetical protein